MGLLNGILKGIRDACDALIDEEDPEPLPSNDPYKRGKQFEDWALKLFPAESFNIIHKTVGGADLDGRYTEDCIYPDYKFRDKFTGREFWVECKYRSHRGEKGNLEWTDQVHLQRYKRIRKETNIPIFILIGIGGFPDDPEELLFFNLDRAPYATLFYSIQKNMTIPIRPYSCLDEIIVITGYASET